MTSVVLSTLEMFSACSSLKLKGEVEMILILSFLTDCSNIS